MAACTGTHPTPSLSPPEHLTARRASHRRCRHSDPPRRPPSPGSTHNGRQVRRRTSRCRRRGGSRLLAGLGVLQGEVHDQRGDGGEGFEGGQPAGGARPDQAAEQEGDADQGGGDASRGADVTMTGSAPNLRARRGAAEPTHESGGPNALSTPRPTFGVTRTGKSVPGAGARSRSVGAKSPAPAQVLSRAGPVGLSWPGAPTPAQAPVHLSYLRGRSGWGREGRRQPSWG